MSPDNPEAHKALDVKSISTGVLIGVLTTVALSAGGLVLNLVTNGSLIHALGGVTKADLTSYEEQNIRDLKLETFSPGFSEPTAREDNSDFAANVQGGLCPEDSILISGYCGIDEQHSSGAKADLRSAGLYVGQSQTGHFECQWNAGNADTFRGYVNAVCLRITKK